MRLTRLLLLVTLVGCAAEETIGSGGTGGTPSGGEAAGGESQGGAAQGGADVGGAGEGGAPSGCAQDCSTIEVPVCYEAVCNEESGVCEIGPMADDAPCEDGLYCTVDDVCLDGECAAGGPRDCTGGNADPCLMASCNEALQSCGTTSAPNGTVCTSLDPCQTNALCVNGQCLGAPLDCSGTPVSSAECEAAACDPATGQCAVGPINNGMACVGGDLCESDKSCDAGVCAGTVIPDCTLCTEMEQNQTYATANVDPTCAAWGGQISVIGDIDCFAVEVTVPGSRIYAETVDVTGSGCPTGFDSVIRLFNSTGTQLASDDQGGAVGGCSAFLPNNVGATNLAVGTYSVCVEDFLNNSTTAPYLLLVDVLPPGCGNGVVEISEDCDGAALGGGSCVSEGFAAGTLGCDASCAYDTSGCVAAGCGNGLLEFGEDCEGSALGCAACELFTCGAGEVPFDISATGLPIPLIDVGSVTSGIVVPTAGTLVSVGVQINVTHTWDSDADIFLTPPGGAQFELSTDNGSSLDNYTNTVFVQNAAAPSVTTGTAPFTGIFQPEGSFTPAIGGPANGTWTLTVTDDLSGFIGTLNAWRVFGCIQP